MKTLKKIAALTIVAGGFMVAGMTSSADAGHGYGYGYGYGFAPSYGYSYNYYRPTYYSYPRVNLLCDAYGCHYFIDSYGIRHNCHLSYGNQYYYYNSYGAQQFVFGY